MTDTYRFVNRNFVADVFEGSMARQANRRHRLAHQHRWDEPMGEMAGLTILLLDRVVDHTLFKCRDHLGMALGTGPPSFRFALHRGRSATGNEDQNSQTYETELPKGPSHCINHHTSPSSF